MNSFFQKIRLSVFIPMLLLNLIGVIAIASTTGGFGGSHYAEKQIGFIIFSFLIALIIVAIPFDFFKSFAFIFYLLGIGLLLFVAFFGHEVKGAKGWIYLGAGLPNLQPSEFMKYFLVLALGKYLMHQESYHRWRDLILPFILCAIPMIFLLKQPDLGSSMIYMPLLFTLLFALGFKLRKILFLLFIGIIFILYQWNYTKRIHPYQKARVMAFWYPEDYKEKEAYQLQSSLTAIGDGGIFGKGYQQGTVHGFDRLPESHTDFIFAVICEDFGLVGGSAIFCLFLFLIFGLMNLLNSTKDPFALCVILGVTIIMFYQVVISMSVVLGLMPTTGLTLPLVSYGGSAVLANYMGVAIAMNVSNHDVLMLSQSEFSEGA